MCGIYGFAGFDETGLLDRMSECLRHRGPDGVGNWDRPGLAMGMRRLSIIDIERGQQPIYNEDGSVVVFQNGEIYNYVELSEELKRLGHVFKTCSDTEVIVHAYEQWGVDCLAHFNGMFAIALYDMGRSRLFLARDRCGQKPLYYWDKGGRFLFASEIKAILESRHVAREPNPAAIDAYLCLRCVPEPTTLFAGIQTLPAAHYLLRDSDGSIKIRRYWDVTLWRKENTYKSEREYLEELESLFFDAVRIAMRSDVPVGAYLSGGVDSSLIVAAMRRFNDRVNTYSIGFRSPVDETAAAARTAKLLGANHHEIYCLAEDFDLLPQVIWHMDRPVGDMLIIAFYKLAAAAARDLKVVISGEGADEMFAGYSFHKVIQWVNAYRQIAPDWLHRGTILPMLRAAPVAMLNRFFAFPAYLGATGKERVLDFLEHYDRRNLSENYVSLKTLWSLDERRAIYSDRFKAMAGDAWIPPVRDQGGPFLDRLLKLQYADWLQDWALIRQDKNAMAHSLEVRLPFLDHRLIELAFRMPPRLKIRGLKDKFIERRLAARLLPPEVVRRPKIPFFFPVEYLFQQPRVKEWIRLTLNEDRIRRRGYFDPAKIKILVDGMLQHDFVHVKQVMSLMILELWHQIFIDREIKAV